MTLLYLINLPHNCSDTEIKQWIESRGFKTCSIRIIYDVIAGASPAFAYERLQDDTQIEEACFALTGKKMRTSQILVSPAKEPTKSQLSKNSADWAWPAPNAPVHDLDSELPPDIPVMQQ